MIFKNDFLAITSQCNNRTRNGRTGNNRRSRIDIVSGGKKDKKKIQFPVVYLGLRRFFPLPQETNLKISISRRQDDEYRKWFEKYYKAILPTEKSINYENYKSENKSFLSVITDDYDSYGSSSAPWSQYRRVRWLFSCHRDQCRESLKMYSFIFDCS
jgi:hypothetical protein